MLVRFACVATAAILALTPSQIRAAPKPPPTARVVAQSPVIEVLRGGGARVMLKGIERNNNILRYEILRPPRHGSLSALEQPDPNRQGPGFVVYSHGNDETSRTDTFIYRVTAPISGQSSTGTVTIQIFDPPPRLGAPAAVEFAAVVGESSTRNLTISNLGGGILRGEVRVRPPFHVEGLAAFELGRGRSTRIPIRFVPLKPGLSTPERIKPSPEDDPSVSVALVGEALPPFMVKTSTEEMALKSDDARTVLVELVNISSQPQEVTVSIDPAHLAEAPSIVNLTPTETREVILRIPPDRRGGAEELRATFSTPVHAETRKFSAPTVPARLVLLTPSIDFGDSREMPLTVENAGGVEGRFILSLPDGMATVEGAENFAVPPATRVTARLRITDPALASDHLVFQTGADDPIRVPVTLTLPEPSATPAPPLPPPLPPPRWALNQAVRVVEVSPGQSAVTFEREKEAWTGVQLEVLGAAPPLWSPFQPPPTAQPTPGLIDSVHAAIMGFFAQLTERDDPTTEAQTAEEPPPAEPNITVPLEAGDTGGLWRLTAEPSDGSQRRTVVSEVFSIDLNGMVLFPSAPPPEPEETAVPEPPRKPVAFSALVDIGQQTTRTSALVEATLAPEPGVTGYRLDRLSVVMPVNPATGIPRPPTVEPVAHDGDARILSVEEIRKDGQNLILVTASINGLPPGMDTAWRLVPLAGNQERPPTKEFFIRTLPPWRLPWKALWLAAAFGFVCFALYLRWKSRRLPE